jgi:hypothetical protein
MQSTGSDVKVDGMQLQILNFNRKPAILTPWWCERSKKIPPHQRDLIFNIGNVRIRRPASAF